MNKTTERIMKVLSLKGFVSPSARISKLNNQGLSGEVYDIVDSGMRNFILKIYRMDNSSKVIKEMKVYQYLSNLGVPVPKVYLADAEGKMANKPFLLIQKLEGEDFSSLIKKGKGREFVESLATSLHKLHSTQPSNLDLKLEKKSFKDEIDELKILAIVLLTFSASPRTFRRVYKTLFEISKTRAKRTSLALLHGDCGPDNTVYCDGTVYLIDLESAYIGDPASDIGYTYHSIKFNALDEPSLADHFVKTYEKLHGKIANWKIYKRLAALKLAIFLKFLGNINPLSIIMLGLKNSIKILALRKHLNRFAEYCLKYAEKN